MIWILLFVFQIKHFLADYPLQGKYMLGKFKKYPDFVLPLLAHSGVHAIFTFSIAYFATNNWLFSLNISLFDLSTHFVVDRIKASPHMLGKFKALSKSEMLQMMRIDKEMTEDYNEYSGSARKRWNMEKVEKIKSNTYFWWALGWDQFMHHMTHYFIIWSILNNV